MKNLLLVLSILLFMACNSSKASVENKKTETTKEVEEVKEVKEAKVAREITATKNEQGYLIGVANKESFEDESFKNWFQSRYNEYETEEKVINQLKTALNGYKIKGFMGTWCGDSKRETPRFYKILDQTEFDQNNFELITVNRSKTTPDNLQEGFDLVRVPTFIFYKNGKEVGRFVEYPRETLEKDILKIVTGKPYKHSYDKSE